MSQEIPIQPVENPILCNPGDEPGVHWVYNPKTGLPTKQESRRPAGYWYKTERTGTAQLSLLAEEERDDLPLSKRAARRRAAVARGRIPGRKSCHARPVAVLGTDRPASAAILLSARGGGDNHLSVRTTVPWQVEPDRISALHCVG